jgi:hypothetical protein
MATFLELQTDVSRILKDENNQATSLDTVKAYINKAVDYYSKKHFWFNEYEEVVNLVVGDPVVYFTTTPKYLFKHGGITIEDQDRRYPLRQVSPERYDCLNIETTGRPYCYCYRNEQYELYYYPDLTYSTTLRGIKEYANLENDDDVNDFTEHAEFLIKYNALSRLYGEFRQDEKQERYFTARAQDEYTNLMNETRQRKRTNRLEVQYF